MIWIIKYLSFDINLSRGKPEKKKFINIYVNQSTITTKKQSILNGSIPGDFEKLPTLKISESLEIYKISRNTSIYILWGTNSGTKNTATPKEGCHPPIL